MAAPIGNLFALGNTGGRPPEYTNPLEFAKKLDEYIEYENAQKNGKGIFTLEGAALYLGFATRDSMYDYAKKDEFSYIVNRFRLFVIDFNVKKLYWGGTYMAGQFWLRNHGGYMDEVTQNQNTRVEKVIIEEKKRDE
jgi:hypothetical protein